MKNLLMLLVVCFGVNFALAQSSTTMQDILETVDTKVVELEEERNQEVVNITLDLLVQSASKSLYRNLDPSFDYTLLAIGDRRIAKLKVTVYKKGVSDWEFVTELSGSRPEIKIHPTEFEQYEFTVSVEDFKGTNTTGHFALMLYHRNPEK